LASISLQNVNKIYPSRHGDVHAVHDLNLNIADGEFVALLGPSGCGKTSTLRMIVGLETVTSGDILFDGERVNDLDPRHRNVAMAFETYALYPNFTVAENLAFPLEVRGIPETERRKKIDQIAQVLRLEPILDKQPGALSGGEQQRVSLGRALIRDPAAFILDEVMSHLDAHLKFQMLFDLKAIHREVRKTMLYVTHDQMEAMALADRVAVMDHARLQQVGTRNELYREPLNLFVADFIGEPPTNFFEATIKDQDGALLLEMPKANLRLELAVERLQSVRERGAPTVVVGIRPQHLSLQTSDQDHHLSATVLINEYLGEQSILTLVSGEQEFRALVPPETDAQEGEVVTLSYADRDVMLFDKGTGQLLS
jgi:multiple sugar transport system ATP-binding protein